jgi:hypothetical protein
MDKENVYIHNGVFSYLEERNHVISRKVDRSGGHQKEISHLFSHMQSLDLKKNDECKRKDCLGRGKGPVGCRWGR